MTKPDEFEATKQVVTTLEPFDAADRERILRWARDKLGMAPVHTGSVLATARDVPTSTPPADQSSDIRSFIEAKKPRTDTQLAAVVAYFHRFVAPESQRKEAIGKEDVLTACRLAGRARPPRLDQTMVNAFSAGYFDRAERGQYKLNSVGENLVAVALPGAPGGEATVQKAGKRKTKKKGKSAARRNNKSRS
jgi:hypothetical protein